MSVVDREPVAPGAAASGMPESRAASDGIPRSGDAIYLLVFNDPEAPAEDYGLGWSLLAFQGSTTRWSQSLAGYGAGAHVGPRQAQAAARQVLAAHGVRHVSWRNGESDGLPMFRAVPHRVRPGDVPAPRGSGHASAGASDDSRWSDGAPWLG